MSTNIEWTNETWNPTTGCAKVSPGCKNCYAETMTKRLAAMGQQKYQGILTESGRFNGTVRTHEDTLRIPFTWRKPRKVFVNSMSDLFHADVPFWFIDRVFATMALTPQHTYQILTKRPDRMAEYYDYCAVRMKLEKAVNVTLQHQWPLHNVWLGISVEDQAAADERIPHLLKCPAAVRFLSCEPLVKSVDMTVLFHDCTGCTDTDRRSEGTHQSGTYQHPSFPQGIHWVIAGGESGPNARPMHPDWARQLRDQCQAAGVAFFFKQWGEYVPCDYADAGANIVRHNGEVHPNAGYDMVRGSCHMRKSGKKAAGRQLDGRTHDEFPNHQSTIINQQSK